MRSTISITTVAALMSLAAFGCKNDTPVDPGQQGPTVGRIIGTVRNNGAAVSGATVQTTPATGTATTGSDGRYVLDSIAPGTYVVSAAKTGVQFRSQNATVVAGATATADIANETSSIPAPNGLMASSTSATSVDLRWIAVAGATSYTVAWTGSGGTGSGSKNVTGTTTSVTGLSAGMPYTFAVSAVTAGGTSNPATLMWAVASRMTTDMLSGTTIRIYEEASSNGSGLTIDPSLGGPKNVSVLRGRPGKVQLAMYVYPNAVRSPDSLILGPIYAITEYVVSAGNDFTKVDSSVYISGQTYSANSLNSWFLDRPLDNLIVSDGNLRAYKILGVGGNTGQGFIVRTGTSSASLHYARIVVKPGTNGLLSGTYPNRYIELEISYQDTPNLPFAKHPVGARVSPPSIPATLYH